MTASTGDVAAGAPATAPKGLYAALELVATEPADAAQYYEWLLDLAPAERPGLALRSAGVLGVREPRDAAEAPGWIPVFAPDDAAASFAAVRDLGGRVEPPVDGTGAAGIAGYVVDPAGSRSALLESGDAPRGLGRGAYWRSNVDYSAQDLERATAFYRGVFDRPVLAVRDDPYDMRFIVDDVYPVVGVFHVPGLSTAARGGEWFVYFEVPDIVRTTARAIESGSRVLVPPIRSPFNTFALLDDPWGSVFGISTIRPDASAQGHALVDESGAEHDLHARFRLRPRAGDDDAGPGAVGR